MANTLESYFGMGKRDHISANRVGDSFRRAMKEGLGDMDRLNSEAEDEEEADRAVMGVDHDQTENDSRRSARDGCPVDQAVELVMARCSRSHPNSVSPPKRFRPGLWCSRERGHVLRALQERGEPRRLSAVTRQETRRQVYLREQHDRAVAQAGSRADGRSGTSNIVVASCGEDDVIMLDVVPED